MSDGLRPGPEVKSYAEDTMKSVEALAYHWRVPVDTVKAFLAGRMTAVGFLCSLVESCPKWVPYIPGRGVVGVG